MFIMLFSVVQVFLLYGLKSAKSCIIRRSTKMVYGQMRVINSLEGGWNVMVGLSGVLGVRFSRVRGTTL